MGIQFNETVFPYIFSTGINLLMIKYRIVIKNFCYKFYYIIYFYYLCSRIKVS